MMSKKASREEAEDVFQDSVKILILSIRKGSFRGESTIKNYLFGICKKVLQSQRVTKDRRVTLSQQIEFETEEKQTPERAFMLQERREILNKLLSEIGEKCQKVLQMWRLDYSMSEIADSMGYKSDGMARKKKHECMKKLILKVQSNPGLLSDLK